MSDYTDRVREMRQEGKESRIIQIKICTSGSMCDIMMNTAFGRQKNEYEGNLL